MRPSSLGGGRILRRTLSVCLHVRLSVRPSRYREPSVTSHHLANYNDTHVLFGRRRAAYRTAISAAQILVFLQTGVGLQQAYNREAGTIDDLSGTREQSGFGWGK